MPLETGRQPVVLQIKEKLGALRVHWRGADDEVVRDLTRLARILSESICEVCGHPGALVTNRYGGRRTRCQAHRDVSDPDAPCAPVQPEQRPRTRRRNLPGSAPMPPASDMPDQVLVDAALLLASELGRLSISMLQVKLKIGYARAERLRNAVLAIASNASTKTVRLGDATCNVASMAILSPFPRPDPTSARRPIATITSSFP